MSYRRGIGPATWAGLCILLSQVPASGQSEPGMLQLDDTPVVNAAPLNQRTADAIAARLRDSGQLKNYRIDVGFQNGAATLSGRVANDAQRDIALGIVRSIPGVDAVRDRLNVDNRGSLLPAQGFHPAAEMAPMPQLTGPQFGPALPPPPPSLFAGAAANFQEPEPIFRAAHPDPMIQPPLMPPYAWPTYAPYNNYSRVAYPQQYPYEAWPFIGPCYPFPKVPLGWRSISLTWEDGYWWYAKNATGHDWWRIRYW